MTADAVVPRTAVDRVQRRVVRLLSITQVLGGIGVGSGIAVSGLIAEDVSGSTALSGLSQTAAVLGGAVAALPMARVMSALGRRPGLFAGYVVATIGACVVITGSAVGSFLLVMLGSTLFGTGTATNLQARYAATDLATASTRARALATVVWATTVGVVLGPNLTGPGGDLARTVGLPALAGPVLFSVAAFAVAALILLVGLRPDPLLEARRRLGIDPAARTHHASLRDAMRAVSRSRAATLGLAAIALSHTVMVSVMVMTPVHMRHEGATLRIVGLVISVHVAGMYALSPLVGWLADRFGRIAVVLLGQLILVVAVVVAGTAGEQAHGALGLGLFFLGVGWSCALVAGSTLLSESVDEEVRTGVQGAADFVMGVCGATGGALAGVVVGGPGYGALNALAGVLVAPVLVAAYAARTARKQPERAADVSL
jgi:MFS family permease